MNAGPCRQCGRPIPAGGTVTCLRSECQEQEYRDNLARTARPKRKPRDKVAQ